MFTFSFFPRVPAYLSRRSMVASGTDYRTFDEKSFHGSFCSYFQKMFNSCLLWSAGNTWVEFFLSCHQGYIINFFSHQKTYEGGVIMIFFLNWEKISFKSLFDDLEMYTGSRTSIFNINKFITLMSRNIKPISQ